MMTSSDPDPLPPMPLLSISSEETVKKCRKLELRDSDLFICSYPKSGTTWCQHIVLSLLLAASNNSRSAEVVKPYSHVSDYAPFFEIDPHWCSDGDELIPKIQTNHDHLARRVFNTHLRYDMLPNSPSSCKAKFIYLLRSPLDACVSFFHHLSHQAGGGYEHDFETFFREWVAGETPFGSWIDHVTSYAEAFGNRSGDQREFLLLTYEDMVKDLPSIVRELIEFLELNDKISDDVLVHELLPSFSFESMRDNKDRFQPKSVGWKNNFSFLRKGKIGDAGSLVSDQQSRVFADELRKRKLLDYLRKQLEDANPAAFLKFDSELRLLETLR